MQEDVPEPREPYRTPPASAKANASATPDGSRPNSTSGKLLQSPRPRSISLRLDPTLVVAQPLVAGHLSIDASRRSGRARPETPSRRSSATSLGLRLRANATSGSVAFGWVDLAISASAHATVADCQPATSNATPEAFRLILLTTHVLTS